MVSGCVRDRALVLLAGASAASHRPRRRCDHGRALPPGGDGALDAVEDRGGRRARRAGGRGARVRGPAERGGHVQSRPDQAADGRGSPAAAAAGHAGHAQGPSLDPPGRDRQQLQLSAVGLGPAVPQLSRPAPGRA